MNRLATLLPFLIAAGMFAPLAAAAEPLAIGLKKQLLVDDHVFSEHVNVTRTLNQPVKHGPVLKPTLPTDQGEIFAMYITVVRNNHDDKFQMWYEAGGIVTLDGLDIDRRVRPVNRYFKVREPTRIHARVAAELQRPGAL